MILSRPLCLILLSLVSVLAGPDDPQSIASLQVYTSLRSCAKECFWGWNGGPVDQIGNALGCDVVEGAHEAMNYCYCRTDLQSRGQSFLTTCVSTNCKLIGGYTNDLSTAASMYEGYCLKQGYTAQAPAMISATATADEAAGTQDSQTMTVIQTVLSTRPATSSSSTHTIVQSDSPSSSLLSWASSSQIDLDPEIPSISYTSEIVATTSVASQGEDGNSLSKSAEIATIVGVIIAAITIVIMVVFGVNQWKKKKQASTRDVYT